MKKCTRCKTEKATSEFRASTRGPLSAWCKCCERAYQREIYANNPEKARERSANWRKKYAKKYADERKRNRGKYYAAEISKKYSIAKHEAERMIREDGLKCKACAVEFDPQKPLQRRNLDHCHKSGKVRGFLCSRCNTVAGLVNDDTKILKSISLYLEKCITT